MLETPSPVPAQNGLIHFVLSSKKKRKKNLLNPWLFSEIPIFLYKWCSIFHVKDTKLSADPIWKYVVPEKDLNLIEIESKSNI